MYKYIFRPLLFLLPAELIHKIIVLILKIAYKIPGFSFLLNMLFKVDNYKLNTEFIGLKFKNPVGLAAGFDKNGGFYNEFSCFGFSFIEIGTITPKPQPGNPKPRSFRLPKDRALINRMGFNNKGVDSVVSNLKKKRRKGLIIGGNIGKNTNTSNENAVDDYLYCFKKLYNYVDYFVVNVSCPNISDLNELQDQKKLEKILFRLVDERKEYDKYKPVLLKISPDLNTKQVDEVIDVYYRTKIDGLIVNNTSVQRTGLITDNKKIEKIGNGGLSGTPLKDMSTKMIQYISQKCSGEIPIIGVGGILKPEDAIEKLNAGAKLIQVYTGFIYEGPTIVKRINKKISNNLQM